MEKVKRTLKNRKLTYMAGKSPPLKIIVAGDFIIEKRESTESNILFSQ
jgi:hypothetical protein